MIVGVFPFGSRRHGQLTSGQFPHHNYTLGRTFGPSVLKEKSGKKQKRACSFHQFPGQGIEHGHPRKIALLRDTDNLAREQHDEIDHTRCCFHCAPLLRDSRRPCLLCQFFQHPPRGIRMNCPLISASGDIQHHLCHWCFCTCCSPFFHSYTFM